MGFKIESKHHGVNLLVLHNIVSCPGNRRQEVLVSRRLLSRRSCSDCAVSCQKVQ
jgi:hypothetical protein